MAIRIQDSQVLLRLIDTVARELVEANIFFRMHTDLIAAAETYSTEMRQSMAFWDRTIDAHLNSAVLGLCKIYDQKKKHLGLSGLLDTIKANLSMLSTEAFIERMRNRPSSEYLIANPPVLDLAQLERDIVYVSRRNPQVDRLIDVRHNFYSHRNAADVVNQVRISDAHPIMRDDVGDLLRGGLEIANRYKRDLHAETYASKIIGHDDYEQVLKAVREKLVATRKAIDEEAQRYGIDRESL